ncbi:MAG: M20 family metallo-hydrolase [Capnocytophaga sp.]|nr:M20 family metallo-hydrolase [Capnocytophaga sp.]
MTASEITPFAIRLLEQLIETPSFSSEEDKTALLIEAWFRQWDIPFHRHLNNVYAFHKHFDENKPTLLLNSHHDTVKPNKAYTRNPFEASTENGRLYGLGSNDAGGCLVSLLAVFVLLYSRDDLNHNVVIVASAEEENSGSNGLNSTLPLLPPIGVAVVGEPTQMNLAIAEKGLVVFEAVVKGTPGHAAHRYEDNAIYNTIQALEWFRDYTFDKASEMLGSVKMTVTQISAGSQHNVVPAEVNLVIDVRVNDRYTNQQIADVLGKEAPVSEIAPRSLRLNSSSIPKEHPLVQAGIALGKTTYGSPTLSDQAVLSCPSLKMGPGDSQRSHSADEYILLSEIEEGISVYHQILTVYLCEG